MTIKDNNHKVDVHTQRFYDEYWPKNVPYYEHTKEYMLRTITEKNVGSALDAGSGHGVCSVVLSEISSKVTAVDISPSCVRTAQEIAKKYKRSNISFVNEDLQQLSLSSDQFDLVWCWGVAMMAPDPMKVISNLVRVCKPGGVIYLGLYRKTWLSPVHQLIRHFCRRFMDTPRRKEMILDLFAWLTTVASTLKGRVINLRTDNVSIQAQVDDWYYPPYKTFYGIKEIISVLSGMGVTTSCIQEQVGRIKSATIFVVRGVRNP